MHRCLSIGQLSFYQEYKKRETDHYLWLDRSYTFPAKSKLRKHSTNFTDNKRPYCASAAGISISASSLIEEKRSIMIAVTQRSRVNEGLVFVVFLPSSYWMKMTNWFGASLSTCRKDEPWSACSKSLPRIKWKSVKVGFGSSGETWCPNLIVCQNHWTPAVRDCRLRTNQRVASANTPGVTSPSRSTVGKPDPVHFLWTWNSLFSNVSRFTSLR